MWNVSMECSAAIVYRRNRGYSCVIPIHPICPANTGSPSVWTMMDITEHISTRSDVNLLVFLNVTWTNIVANGLLIVSSCRDEGNALSREYIQAPHQVCKLKGRHQTRPSTHCMGHPRHCSVSACTFQPQRNNRIHAAARRATEQLNQLLKPAHLQ